MNVNYLHELEQSLRQNRMLLETIISTVPLTTSDLISQLYPVRSFYLLGGWCVICCKCLWHLGFNTLKSITTCKVTLKILYSHNIWYHRHSTIINLLFRWFLLHFSWYVEALKTLIFISTDITLSLHSNTDWHIPWQHMTG